MSELWKVKSGASKQTIPPKIWTYVKYPTMVGYKVGRTGTWEWTTMLRVEFATGGSVLRGRFVRYPGTPKKDETGHDDKNIGGWDNKVYHCHWSHTLECGPRMPVGFWIWHDSAAAIVLDGRQIKAKRL
tara:strand:- start:300 stop:686 length:387 start_codon:yes stop_codon:yes gene_type:complete